MDSTQRYLGECIVDDILTTLNDDEDSPWGEYGKDVSVKEHSSGSCIVVVVEFTNPKDNRNYIITIEEKI